MSPITTHVLDTARGKPAGGIPVTLEFESDGQWIKVGSAITGDDGRVRQLLAEGMQLSAGNYRITFATGTISDFYPWVEVTFAVGEPSQHYHIPLLLSPFGYSTYRGS